MLINIINDRVLKEAKYLIDTQKTVREVANEFKISKSTVHKDLKDRLPKINKEMFIKIQNIMQKHIQERHIKGGESTKNKYKRLK